MKNVVRFLTLAAVAALIPMGLMAQSDSQATANANAYILAPIVLTADTDLNFGDIVPSAAADTVEVATDGTLTAGAGVTHLGGENRGMMFVTGEVGRTFAVTVNTGSGTLSNGTDTMAFDWSADCQGACTVAAAPGAPVYLGGILYVGVSQAAGAYTGTFDVTVAYN
jgi:hypothetical protein